MKSINMDRRGQREEERDISYRRSFFNRGELYVMDDLICIKKKHKNTKKKRRRDYNYLIKKKKS